MTDDQLRNVKGFFAGEVLAGFGARTHLRNDRLPQHVRVLHDWVVPKLYDAIRAHDPVWDPAAEIEAGHWVVGKPQQSFTIARGTEAVRWFVELMEFAKAFNGFIDSTPEWYDVMFGSSNQVGCFLDGLVAALRADDPAWRG